MSAKIYGLKNTNDDFEKKTIKKFASYLYDDWNVLVPPRKVGSEGDIAVLNKSYLALIEIKASDLKWRNGGLEQLNRAENEWYSVDPIAQLERVFKVLISKSSEYFETNRFVPKFFSAHQKVLIQKYRIYLVEKVKILHKYQKKN